MNEQINAGGNNAEPDYENIDAMSHAEAEQLNAAQRYSLHKLSPEQENRFEAHYFECATCAHAVEREQFMLPASQSKRQPWWRRVAVPALVPVTAASLAVAGFETFYSIPSLKMQLSEVLAPQANTSIIAHPVQMGSEDGEQVKTESVTIEFNLPDDSDSPLYRVELRSEGKPAISQVVPAPARSRVSLHLMRRTLGHGPYNVLVYGLTNENSQDGPQIGQYHFDIK
jgi:hypothetical protein